MTTHAPTFASQRLTPETTELLIPLKPPLPRRLDPRRRSRRDRMVRWVRTEGVCVGWLTSAGVMLGYTLVELAS